VFWLRFGVRKAAECHVCIGLGAKILQLYRHHHSCRVNSLTQWHCTPGPLWECKKTARHIARVKAACHVFNFAPNYTACGRCIHSESSSLRAKFPSLERAPQECGLGRRSWTSGGWMLPWVATGLPCQLTFASSLWGNEARLSPIVDFSPSQSSSYLTTCIITYSNKNTHTHTLGCIRWPPLLHMIIL
jgi:hypothetical protein